MKSRLAWAAVFLFGVGFLMATPLVLHTLDRSAKERAAEAAPPEVKAVAALESKIGQEAIAYLDAFKAKSGPMSADQACEQSAWRRQAIEAYQRAGKSRAEAHNEFMYQAQKTLNPTDREHFEPMIREAVMTCHDANPG